MDQVKSISFYIVAAIALNLIAKHLQSDFIGPFLRDNIVSILINLLAINIATCTILMTKLNEIREKHKVDFSGTFKALKISLKEQVVLITISFVALTADKSIILIKSVPNYVICINILLTAIFIYAIDILWDIGKAVFTIINR